MLDIVPLSELHVTIKAGKAASVEVPKDAGLTAKVEGDTVTIAAAKDAPEGARQLTVKSIKGKAATLQVNVKKGACCRGGSVGQALSPVVPGTSRRPKST